MNKHMKEKKKYLWLLGVSIWKSHLVRKWRFGYPLLRSFSTTQEQIDLWKIQPFFKKFFASMTFKLKINVMRKYFELQLYSTKPSVGQLRDKDWTIGLLIKCSTYEPIEKNPIFSF
jgi:hypothetical protein